LFEVCNSAEELNKKNTLLTHCQIFLVDFIAVAPKLILITNMLFPTLKDFMIIPLPLYIKVKCIFIKLKWARGSVVG
jgi:hypothetical protein